jgi:hypothetical protein
MYGTTNIEIASDKIEKEKWKKNNEKLTNGKFHHIFQIPVGEI